MPVSEITLATLARMKRDGDKITCLTAYDASFTRLLEDAGLEVLLVGDSLGMVVQGHDSTLPVRVEHMLYHCASVARARRRALIVADLPFMSYSTPAQALGTAARLMQEGGAQMVKLEGGADQVDTVRYLVQSGIPVCAHLGLLPQSVHQLGGYRVQGRDELAAQVIRDDALALEEAGAGLLVLECIPAELARTVTESLAIPTVGIGAGRDVDGQVLVLYDMLGITPRPRPRFVRDFMAEGGDIAGALRAYVSAVKAGAFPDAEHSYP